jgi:hypothetical protein
MAERDDASPIREAFPRCANLPRVFELAYSAALLKAEHQWAALPAAARAKLGPSVATADIAAIATTSAALGLPAEWMRAVHSLRGFTAAVTTHKAAAEKVADAADTDAARSLTGGIQGCPPAIYSEFDYDAIAARLGV